VSFFFFLHSRSLLCLTLFLYCIHFSLVFQDHLFHFLVELFGGSLVLFCNIFEIRFGFHLPLILFFLLSDTDSDSSGSNGTWSSGTWSSGTWSSGTWSSGDRLSLFS